MQESLVALETYLDSTHLFLLQKVQLLVTVIDYDRVGGNEPIGQVLLGADQKGCRSTCSVVSSPT